MHKLRCRLISVIKRKGHSANTPMIKKLSFFFVICWCCISVQQYQRADNCLVFSSSIRARMFIVMQVKDAVAFSQQKFVIINTINFMFYFLLNIKLIHMDRKTQRCRNAYYARDNIQTQTYKQFTKGKIL